MSGYWEGITVGKCRGAKRGGTDGWGAGAAELGRHIRL